MELDLFYYYEVGDDIMQLTKKYNKLNTETKKNGINTLTIEEREAHIQFIKSLIEIRENYSKFIKLLEKRQRQ